MLTTGNTSSQQDTLHLQLRNLRQQNSCSLTRHGLPERIASATNTTNTGNAMIRRVCRATSLQQTTDTFSIYKLISKNRNVQPSFPIERLLDLQADNSPKAVMEGLRSGLQGQSMFLFKVVFVVKLCECITSYVDGLVTCPSLPMSSSSHLEVVARWCVS